jgi:hypothetical protein
VLQAPVVLLLNAQKPTAVLFEAVLVYRAKVLQQYYLTPVILEYSVPEPSPTLLFPVVVNLRASKPNAVFLNILYVLEHNAVPPTATLYLPVVLQNND